MSDHTVITIGMLDWKEALAAASIQLNRSKPMDPDTYPNPLEALKSLNAQRENLLRKLEKIDRGIELIQTWERHRRGDDK